MQIAWQVCGINTAENALIFFNNGTAAYLTKRFDVKNEVEKWGKEDFALDKGLFADDFRSETYKKTSHANQLDFVEFAKRIGINAPRIDKLLQAFLVRQALVESLIQRSFLSDPAKRGYLLDYQTKRNHLSA